MIQFGMFVGCGGVGGWLTPTTYIQLAGAGSTKFPNLSNILHPTRRHEENFFRVSDKNVFASFIMKHAVFVIGRQ